jgi:hypothetical protein
MSVVIVGSRDFNDYRMMCNVMHRMQGLESVVLGGALTSWLHDGHAHTRYLLMK